MDDDAPEPRRLRQLRWLVNALTITLIAGFIVIVATLVIRLGAAPPVPVLPVLPASVTLPDGETARAVTFGSGWVAVVTMDATGVERIHVWDTAGGRARATMEIPPAE